MRNRRQSANAFTLIEMLVVIFVIGILVAIVVGVSGVVIQRAKTELTKQTLKVLVSAVEAYHDVWNDYPLNSSPLLPSGQEAAPAPADQFYAALMSVGKAQEKLSALNKECVQGNSFLDGFGWPIHYWRYKGKGGGPLLISAGPDRKFGYETNYDVEENRLKAVDNIYSDGR